MLKHDSTKTLMNSEQRNISDYMSDILNITGIKSLIFIGHCSLKSLYLRVLILTLCFAISRKCESKVCKQMESSLFSTVHTVQTDYEGPAIFFYNTRDIKCRYSTTSLAHFSIYSLWRCPRES